MTGKKNLVLNKKNTQFTKVDTGTLQGMLESISVYGRAPSEHAQLRDDNGDYSKQILKLSELFFNFSSEVILLCICYYSKLKFYMKIMQLF